MDADKRLEERDKKLEEITKALNAISKLKDTYSLSSSRSAAAGVEPALRSVFTEMLQVVSEHSPERHRKVIGKTLEKSARFSEAYRIIKQNIRTVRKLPQSRESLGARGDALFGVLNAVRPVLDRKKRVMVEKFISIYEILKS